MARSTSHIAVIGAGIGGLAAALRLAHAGLKVSVFDMHSAPGGKMRTVPSDAGPVDAGPTVLTMKPVFDQLFHDVGEHLEDHVSLEAESVLARHFWRDGTRLDLMSNFDESRANVDRVFGGRVAREFTRFSRRAASLYEAFDAPMMRSGKPSRMAVAARVLANPGLVRAMAPHLTLGRSLTKQFSEPKLAQLFARYATYVGGDPSASPALLSLIAHSEAMGVWHVKGGMHRLAKAIEALASRFGAEFHYNAPVTEIRTGQEDSYHLQVSDQDLRFDKILFNGDPRALKMGALGSDVVSAISEPHCIPRSLSAFVHSFAARADGVDLAGHNVFFSDTPNAEFDPIAQGKLPTDPTLYLCAQDRFGGATPNGLERFEIIMNGAPIPDETPENREQESQCQTLTFTRLSQFGLTFSPTPGPRSLTSPSGFARLFPKSNGALYGRSPHGMMAAFKRPTARTRISGLYLVGGGAHPGAGIPMATLSAQHAAAAILSDLTSTSTFQRRAMRGGISTVSATAEHVPSRSSLS